MNCFKDKVIVLTGGASGFGEALGLELASRGASIVASDIDAARLEKVVSRINESGGRAQARALDVTDSDAVREAIDSTVAEQGRIDYLFNSAGVFLRSEARHTSLDLWRRIVNINLMGMIYGVDAAYRHMVKQGHGHIVNMASVAGLVGYPTATAYTTTKHAVVGLSLTLRAEAASLGVKVSVVCPGPIATGIGSRALGSGTADDVDPSGVDGRELLERVTLTILKGVEQNKGMIIFPKKARRQWRLFRLLPSLFVPITQKRIKNYRRKQDKASS